jgi:Ala-tRNA(Pro) deacylase
MSGKERLERYLQENGVPFVEQHHRTAFTAQDVAAAEHVPGQRVAKGIVVFADGQPRLMVVPAARRLHLEHAAEAADARELRLASEQELAPLFPDCELGALPPFGNLYDLPVYVDDGFDPDEEFVIQAGTHRDTIHMSYHDFERLTRPVVAHLTA